MKRKKSFLIIICFALLLLFAFIFFFGRQGKIDNPLLPIDELAEKWKGNQDLPSGGENQEIDVPGFKTLVFRANQTSQKVNFYNPEENECLFKLKLYANDKQLWESANYA